METQSRALLGVFVVAAAVIASASDARAQDRGSAFPQLVVQNTPTDVAAMIFAPDSRVAISCAGAQVNIWDVATARLLRAVAIAGECKSLALAGDGTTLAVGMAPGRLPNNGRGPNIEIWNLADGRKTTSLGSAERWTPALAFDRTGALVAATGEHVLSWDIAAGSATTLAASATPIRFTALAVIDEAGLVAAGNNRGQIQLIDRVSGIVVRTLTGHKAEIARLAVSPDGKTLASGGKWGLGNGDNDVILWDIATGGRLGVLRSENKPKPAFGLPEGGIDILAFASDGSRLLVAGQNNAVKIWTLADRRIERVVVEKMYAVAANADWSLIGEQPFNGIRLVSGSGAPVRNLGFFGLSRSSRNPAGTGDAVIVLGEAVLSAETLQPVSAGRGMLAVNGRPRTVERPWLGYQPFGVGGQTFADVVHDDYQTARCPEVDDWQLLAISRDSTKAVVRSPSVIAVCDLVTAQLSPRLNASGLFSFSWDGSRIAEAAPHGAVRVWSPAGQLLTELKGHGAELSDAIFSPDGTLIASAASGRLPTGELSGTPDVGIRIWNAASGALVHTLEGHRLGTNSLAFRNDGQVLASSGRDGTIKMWDVATGALLHTFEGVGGHAPLLFHASGWLMKATPDSLTAIDPQTGAIALSVLYQRMDWLATTPEGRFDGSPRGWKRVLWRMSDALFDVHPIEVGFRQFFTPGLVRDVLSRTPLPALTRSISETDLRRPAVALSLTPAAGDAPITARTTVANLTITDGGTGARDVRLLRNGTVIKMWRQELDLTAGPAHLETEVPIAAGPNVFTAYAFSRDDVKGDDATVTVQGAPSLKRFGKLYVLAIGINDYADARFNLKYARADAVGIKAAIESHIVAFDAVEIVSLLDAHATREGILAAIGRLASVLEPEDAAVIYYAGHGVAAGERFHLLPHDFVPASGGGRDTVGANTVTDRDLEELFARGSSTGRIVLILDACNSGQILAADDPRRGPMNSRGLGQLAYERGAYVLAASQAFQSALETNARGHGDLTFALLEGINGAVRQKGGALLGQQMPAVPLLEYAARRVPQLQRNEAEAKRGLKLPGSAATAGVQQPRLFVRDDLDSINPLVLLLFPG